MYPYHYCQLTCTAHPHSHNHMYIHTQAFAHTTQKYLASEKPIAIIHYNPQNDS